MTELEIIERLRTEALPETAAAREQAAQLMLAATGARRSPRGRRWRLAGLGFLATGLLALTPPVQSLAENVGELVGIGEEASLPGEHFGSMEARGDSYVLASGAIPGSDQAFEIAVGRAVFADQPLPAPGDPGGEKTCLTVDFPSTPQLGTGEYCLGDTEDPDWLGAGGVIDAVNHIDAAGKLPSDARYVITAIVSPDVKSVELRYENSEGETELALATVGTVDHRIRELIHTRDHVGYMVGFIPDDGVTTQGPPGTRTDPGALGTVQITGYDANGDAIGHDALGERVVREMAQQQRGQEQREQGFPPDESAKSLVVEALICSSWPVSEQQARSVGWCGEALDALEHRAGVQALAESGDYRVHVDGMTVTVTLPDGSESVSTLDR